LSRVLTGTAQTQIAKKTGTEPVFAVGIFWSCVRNAAGQIVSLGAESLHCDTDMPNLTGGGIPIPHGEPCALMSVSGFESVQEVSTGKSSNNVSVTLEDSGGLLHDFISTINVLKIPVQIYQLYEGLDFDHRILLFTGEVSSPIKWTEGGRLLSFDVTDPLEGKDVGFSIESAEQTFFARESVGKAWPICFGSPIRVPAVKIFEQVKGASLTKYGLITHDELKKLEKAAESYAAQIQPAALAQVFAGSGSFLIAPQHAARDADLTTLGLDKFANGVLLAAEVTGDGYFAPAATPIAEVSTDDAVMLDGISDAAADLQAELDALLEWSPTLEADLRQYAEVCTALRLRQDESALIQQQLNEDAKEIGLLQLGPSSLADIVIWRAAEVSGLNRSAVKTKMDDQTTKIGTVITAIQTHDGLLVAADINLTANIAALEATKTALETVLLALSLTAIQVEGGNDFPQATEIQVLVNNLRLKGIFTGELFTVTDNQMATDTAMNLASRDGDETRTKLWLADSDHDLKNKYCLVYTPAIDDFNPMVRVIYIVDQNGSECTIEPIIWDRVDGEFPYAYHLFNENDIIIETSPIVFKSWRDAIGDDYDGHYTGLAQLPIKDWKLNIGDTVYLDGSFQDTYVFNLVPTTSVLEVIGERSIKGVTTKVPIPSRYYTVGSLDSRISGFASSIVTFKRPLRAYQGEGWSDKVWVTCQSSLGSNTADILQWIITNWTTLGYDGTSFTYVNGKLTNYPSNFALTSTQSALKLLHEIAWQARCRISMNALQTIKITYLAEEPASVKTLTDADIELKSLEVSFTPIEDMVTVFKANWRDDLSAEEKKVILLTNVPTFGRREGVYDFYIYNIRELVVKSATFWAIRYGNSWKRASFVGFLNQLDLETLDCVTLNLSKQFLALGAIKGIIEHSVYDSGSLRFKFDIWLPIIAGQMTQDQFAWPASLGSGVRYPADSTTTRFDTGEQYPSDSGDTLPADPTTGRQQYDYSVIPRVHRHTTRQDYLREIDIHKTQLIDSALGVKVLLNTLLATAKTGRVDAIGNPEHVLALKATANIKAGNGDVGPIALDDRSAGSLIFDTVMKIFRPSGTAVMAMVKITANESQYVYTADVYENGKDGGVTRPAQTIHVQQAHISAVLPNDSWFGPVYLAANGTWQGQHGIWYKET